MSTTLIGAISSSERKHLIKYFINNPVILVLTHLEQR